MSMHQRNNFQRNLDLSGFEDSFQDFAQTSQQPPTLILRDCVAMHEWTILVISSGARDLTFFSYMRRKDFSPEFILSEVEGARNDNCDTLSSAGVEPEKN
jgi:hypothetical protein